MKRLPQIAKEQNIGVSTLISYCEKLGLGRLKRNTKINQETEQQILGFHRGEIEFPRSFDNKEPYVSSTQEIPNEFQPDHPFQEEQLKVIAVGDRFSDRKEEIISFEGSELSTIFSDFEAYSICAGLDNRRAKNLARIYFKSRQQSESD